MIKLLWWKNTVSIKEPRTVLKALKRLFYYKLPFSFRNFGDELSPAIVSSLSQQQVTHTLEQEKVIALGSILHFAKPGDYIWGTGLLRRSLLPQTKDIKICAVRGALTQEVLLQHGYDCPSVYGDPGLLAPYLWNKPVAVQYEVGIIPHWSQFRYLNKYVASSSLTDSVKLIRASDPWEKVIAEIRQCRAIVSTSLHGLILSDAYGIPRTMYYIDQPPDASWFKYEDYSSSINVDFTPYEAAPSIDSVISLAGKAKLNPINEEITKKMLAAAPFKISSVLVA